ncbi:MAG: hypothetical protein RLZZ165_2090, partial [Bacteroidota bacterium]
MKPSQEKKKKSKVGLAEAFHEYIWPRRGIIGIGLILIVVSRGAGIVLPYSSKVLMDDVVGKKNLDLLWILLTLVVVSLLIQAVTSFLLTKLLSVEAQRLISQLRANVQQHILSLPISYFDNTKSGALVSRIMTNVE